MKKLIAAISVVFCISCAFGQKCEFVKNEKDKFNGKKLVVTKAPLFSEFTKRAEILFGLSNDTLAVIIGYVENSPQSLESSETSELWLSLSDGTVLKLKPFQAYKGRVREAMGNSTESVFQPRYGLSKEQLQMLTKTAITGFHMATLQGSIQKDVAEKNQKKILAAAKCLLESL